MPGQAKTSSTTKALPISEANSSPRIVSGGTKAGRSMYLNMRTAVGHAEGARRLDIVLLGDVDHGGARDARDLADAWRRESASAGKEDVLQSVTEGGEIAFHQRVDE